MSQLAIWIGRSFIELSRKSGSETQNKRVSYFINSLGTQLKAALTGFAEEGDKVTLEWQLPYVTVDRELGNPTAFLTTSGTENWLELNLPLQPRHWSTQLEHAPMPLTRELCFGVAERTSATGDILRAPEKEDLDFLVEKLRLNKVTHVAIGFLHAHKNPTNEKKVAEHFREQGFQVTASHDWANESEERPRFWAAIAENYVDGFLTEKLTEIEAALTACGIKTESSHLPKRRWFKDLPFLQVSRPTLYCGVDEILFFTPDAAPQWITHFGPVAAPGLGALRLQPSPLQMVDRDFWNSLSWSATAADWDLGPMCFGKGMKPTLLDVFQVTGKLVPTPGLNERLNDKNAKKIVDTLRAYTRAGSKSMDEQDALDGLLRTLAENWRQQIPHPGPIYLVGPMAATLHAIFKNVGMDAGIVLDDEENYVSEKILRLVTQ